MDPQRNNKKCPHGSSSPVFHLRGGDAVEQKCIHACHEDENCVAFSGVWNSWRIGCGVALTEDHNSATAFKKTGN